MNDIWDDPEWEDLRRRVDGRPLIKPEVRSEKDNDEPRQVESESTDTREKSQKVEVNLKLTLPKLALPKMPKLTIKQRKIGLVCTITFAGLILAGLVISRIISKDPDPSGNGMAKTVVKPPFKTILPDGEKSLIEGEIKYDSPTQVVSYSDTIGKVLVTVSQQKLPGDFSADPEEGLRKVAEGLTASEILRESHPRVFLGNNPQGSPTAVFHKDGFLIFIVASQYLEKDEWVEYILKLEQE